MADRCLRIGPPEADRVIRNHILHVLQPGYTQVGDESEARLTRDVAKLIAPARALGLPESSGPLKRAICVTRSPGAKRKLAMRMLASSCPMMHPLCPDVVFTHPNCTSLPSVKFTCTRPGNLSATWTHAYHCCSHMPKLCLSAGWQASRGRTKPRHSASHAAGPDSIFALMWLSCREVAMHVPQCRAGNCHWRIL